ncbi:MAG: thiamine pyrophosphokinase [Sphingobacteriales bacterium]|nr:MAG: thiamine pyrophosphokinase [Sphingobacteriales bacterium]TAF82289.1 MAG: thiamine pyrophosphokinase [Sphingobacteriales bacterium]
MSSHHIVREKQEPALLILSLDSIDEEHLGQLLEWSPTIIVNTNVYEKITAMGIKIDVLICETKTSIYFQESIRFIYTTKSQTALQAAISFLSNQKYPAVNIVCKTFDLQKVEPFVGCIDIVVFTERKKYYPIKNGFNKWETANTTIHTFGNISNHYGTKKIAPNSYITLYDGFFGFDFEQNYLFIAHNV